MQIYSEKNIILEKKGELTTYFHPQFSSTAMRNSTPSIITWHLKERKLLEKASQKEMHSFILNAFIYFLAWTVTHENKWWEENENDEEC